MAASLVWPARAARCSRLTDAAVLFEHGCALHYTLTCLSGKRRGNCVLLASQHPLHEMIDRDLRSDAVSVRLARTAQVEALARAGRVLGPR